MIRYWRYWKITTKAIWSARCRPKRRRPARRGAIGRSSSCWILATGAKISVFAVLLRAVSSAAPEVQGAILSALGPVAVLSVVVGNLGALTQPSVKRLLAYSSVAQVGYLLLALAGLGNGGAEAALFYAASYALVDLGANLNTVADFIRREMTAEQIAKQRETVKVKSLDELAQVVRAMAAEGKRVVLCHGVFDLLHPGHMRHFEAAKRHGDVLVVTVTPDQYVAKGPGRPAFNQRLRAESIAALACDGDPPPGCPSHIRTGRAVVAASRSRLRGLL